MRLPAAGPGWKVKMNNAEIADFFAHQKVKIVGNSALREPQRDGYYRIKDHFASSREPGYIQLPVGCGKTGLMGLSPFSVAEGRVGEILQPGKSTLPESYPLYDRMFCAFRENQYLPPIDPTSLLILAP